MYFIIIQMIWWRLIHYLRFSLYLLFTQYLIFYWYNKATLRSRPEKVTVDLNMAALKNAKKYAMGRRNFGMLST